MLGKYGSDPLGLLVDYLIDSIAEFLEQHVGRPTPDSRVIPRHRLDLRPVLRRIGRPFRIGAGG